jgi:hypothetical protein
MAPVVPLTTSNSVPSLDLKQNHAPLLDLAHWYVASDSRNQEKRVLKEQILSDRMKHVRAGARVNSRVPISVEWEEAKARHSVNGWTVDVGPKGCLAIVPQGFAIGQKLRLINLVNKNSVDAILIWRGHEGRTGWELGLELQDAGEEFWGVDF